MSSSAQKIRLILHVTGQTQLPVLPALAALLDQPGLELSNLFQSRLDDSLAIGAVVSCSADAEAFARGAVQDFAREHGLVASIHLAGPTQDAGTSHCRICVTLLGHQASPRALAVVGQELAAAGLLIEEAHSFGGTTLRGIDLLCGRRGKIPRADFEALRAAVLAKSAELGVDLAVQRDDFYRRSKRLLCMDVDSTFVKGEFIDELAELAGVKQQVAEITARAMRGELDFSEALRARVRLLRGLPFSRAQELCSRFELTPGAGELVRMVKQLGMRVGLVSGGFDFFVAILKERYGLDFAFANELEVDDQGLLTGEVIGTIVDPARKAQVLRDMAHVFGIRMEQTIAAGDGANDIQMLQTAGLGIAYQAKPRLREVAHTQFNQHDRLDTLLYLMGYDPTELAGACR